MRLCMAEIAIHISLGLAPEVGFEPTTNRLIPTASGLYH